MSEQVFVVDGSLLVLLLFSKFIGAVGVSVVDSIKLGKVTVSVGKMSCGGTGCLSCRGKQSTSSSSLSGRSLLLCLDLFFRFSVAGRASVGDSMRLLQLETAVGRYAMAVGVEYQGGLGGIGIGGAVEGLGNPMVIVVVKLMGVEEDT